MSLQQVGSLAHKLSGNSGAFRKGKAKSSLKEHSSRPGWLQRVGEAGCPTRGSRQIRACPVFRKKMRLWWANAETLGP